MNELQSVGGKGFSCRWRRFYRSFQLVDLLRKRRRERGGKGVEGRRVGKDGLGSFSRQWEWRKNRDIRVADFSEMSTEGAGMLEN